MKEQGDFVIRAKNGDSKAFAQIYEQYANELYKFAFYYLGTREDAQDAVQDAVCDAFRAINSLKNEDSFKPWLFKILSNCCKKQISKRIMHRNSILEVYEDFSEHTPEMSDALYLKSAISKLGEQERAIVVLCSVNGYTSREVAQILQMPSGTVRSKLSRALQKLRITLEEDSYEKTR